VKSEKWKVRRKGKVGSGKKQGKVGKNNRKKRPLNALSQARISSDNYSRRKKRTAGGVTAGSSFLKL